MSNHEGRCPNCGSIVPVNMERENYCLFCHAVVDPEEAQRLAKDSTGHKFPMDTQPELSEEQIQAMRRQYGTGGGSQAKAKPRKTTSDKPVKRKAEEKPSPAEQVAKLNRPLPAIQVNKKLLTIVLAATVLLVALGVGIAVPYQIKQKEHRTALMEVLKKQPELAENQVQFSLGGMRNQHMKAVSKEEITEDVAKRIFESYRQAYEAEYDTKSSSTLEVRIFSEAASYRVSKQGSEPLGRIAETAKND